MATVREATFDLLRRLLLDVAVDPEVPELLK